MSFLGNGLIGNALSTMVGGALDSFMSGDELETSPIPSFYFEVISYKYDINEAAKEGFEFADRKTVGMGEAANSGLSALGGNLLSAAQGMVSGPNTLNPGKHDKDWTKKAFIEVSGLEIGIDNDQKTEGGNNYPLNLPGKMRNQPITLKRLVRKKTIDDDWSQWINGSIESAALWNKPIEPRIIQINVMYPKLGEDGDPHIVSSIELYGAYPTKLSYGTLSSTSEDLVTQEIEISFSSMKIVKP